MNLSDYYTLSQAAYQLGINPDSVRRVLEHYQIPIIPACHGGREAYLVSKAQVDDLATRYNPAKIRYSIKDHEWTKTLDPDEYYTLEQVATKLGIKRGSVVNALKRQGIEGTRAKIDGLETTFVKRELIDNLNYAPSKAPKTVHNFTLFPSSKDRRREQIPPDEWQAIIDYAERKRKLKLAIKTIQSKKGVL